MAAVYVQGERQIWRVDQDDYSVDVHGFFFVFANYQKVSSHTPSYIHGW